MIIDYTQFEENSLLYYVTKGDLEGLNTWIEEHPSELEALTQPYNMKELFDSAPPLNIAACHGHLAIVNRLLEFEAVRNNITAMDNEALRWAAGKGHLAVVNTLLKFKAVRNNIAAGYNYALRHALENDHLTIASALLLVYFEQGNSSFKTVPDDIKQHRNYYAAYQAGRLARTDYFRGLTFFADNTRVKTVNNFTNGNKLPDEIIECIINMVDKMDGRGKAGDATIILNRAKAIQTNRNQQMQASPEAQPFAPGSIGMGALHGKRF